MDNGSILIVDDNPRNLRLLATILSNQGYEVRPANNGQMALWAIQAEVADLIMLDIMMPGMDGYEVCQQLKADEQTKDIPVIFASALDDTFDKVVAFSVGGVDYITKPFEEAEVLARVKTHIALRQAQQQLAQHNDELEHQVKTRTAELAQINRDLQAEIKQRQQHQQEKEHLFELARQQSEQLRLLTNSLLESQSRERHGLVTGLDQEIQQNISLLRTNLKFLQSNLTEPCQGLITAQLKNTNLVLEQMERYVTQVTHTLHQTTHHDQALTENPLLKLTAREQEVLQLIVEGKTHPEIAAIISVALGTVHTYSSRIKHKLGISDTPSLVKLVLAYQNKL